MVSLKELLDHACMQIWTDFVHVSINVFIRYNIFSCTYDEKEVTSDDLFIVKFKGLGLGLGKATQTA